MLIALLLKPLYWIATPSARDDVFIKSFPLILLLVLSGCSLHEVDNCGYNFQNCNIAAVKTGVTTKEEVLKLFGTPTSKSQFGQETWYYIYRARKRVAFMQPKMLDQRILAITFERLGKVQAISEITEQEAVSVAFDRDSTEPVVPRIGVVEQLVSNVGKFKRPSPNGNM